MTMAMAFLRGPALGVRRSRRQGSGDLSFGSLVRRGLVNVALVAALLAWCAPQLAAQTSGGMVATVNSCNSTQYGLHGPTVSGDFNGEAKRTL